MNEKDKILVGDRIWDMYWTIHDDLSDEGRSRLSDAVSDFRDLAFEILDEHPSK